MDANGVVLDRPLPLALLADDDPLVRAALCAQLERGFSVVAVADDAASAITLAREHRPDVALVDVEMPGGGLQAARGIHHESPETAVVILTTDRSRSSVLQFLDAGAMAYLRKGISGPQLAARLTEAIAAHSVPVKRADHRPVAAQDRFRAAFHQAGVGMAIVLLDGSDAGRLVEANLAFARMLGREVSELVGANLEKWTHPDDLPDGVKDPLAALARGDVERVEFDRRYLRNDGRVVDALETAVSYLDENARWVAIIQVLDISERKRLEGQLEYLADHDTVTGLLNRRRFQEELDRELTRVRRYGGVGAVLSLDLDDFKYVNDSLGHAAGDELVTSLAETIRGTLRESDIVARTGGDGFAVILPEADEQAAWLACARLLSAICRGGLILRGSLHAHVTTSIGLTLFGGRDQIMGGDLLVEADMAMHEAKVTGKNRICAYNRDEAGSERATARLGWHKRLQDAIAEERFVLYAQPIVPVCSDDLARFELLLRLPDDDGDLISPGTFLYYAERFDLIVPIDHWVMSQAVQMLHKYYSQGTDISLAINVSAKTLNDGAIGERLHELLKTYPIPEGRLVLELTETAAIANMERARELARYLQELGCQLALDDFGAGFASFYYLKHLAFDYVKIDGEFIKHLPESKADQLIVRAVVDITRGFGTDTIAEFVQDDETMALLRELGVGYAQGYHTGRPGPLEKILPPLRRASDERY